VKRRLLYVIAVTLLAAGAAVMVLSLGVLGGGDSDEVEPLAVGTPLPTQVPTTAPPTPTPKAQGDPRLAALDITRLVVPKIGINAPIVVLGILPDGTMASPKGPTEVAWYTFSSKPGEVGNVVMAGHLDYINYGAAVFYRLRDLRPGDDLQVVLSDGTQVKYVVESVTSYDGPRRRLPTSGDGRRTRRLRLSPARAAATAPAVSTASGWWFVAPGCFRSSHFSDLVSTPCLSVQQALDLRIRYYGTIHFRHECV
jgi:hypothetical protein